MSKLLRTLARLNAEAPSTTGLKIASAPAPLPTEPEMSGILKKIAQSLRELPPVTVTDEDLYAVLRGNTALPAASPADLGDDPSHLRKVAHALRSLDAEREAARMEKAAGLLIAARGLTLMDEQTRTR